LKDLCEKNEEVMNLHNMKMPPHRQGGILIALKEESKAISQI
jgi:hypothetical protein